MTMPDTNGWSKAELYVMEQLHDLKDGQDRIYERLEKLPCQVHIERLKAMQDQLKQHDDDINSMKGWRSQMIGAASVVSVIVAWLWSKFSKFL
jgi:hypothetical protein